MSRSVPMRRAHYRLLLRSDLGRAARFFARPRWSALLGSLLPVVLLVGILSLAGGSALPPPAGASAGLALALLVSGSISFLAYGILFSAADTFFLRQLGIDLGALFLGRASRLAALALGIAFLVSIPFLGAGSFGAAWVIGIAAGAVATGGSAVAYAAAARILARSSSALGGGIRAFDPELARAAPLIYAPLLPFLTGAFAGTICGALPTRAGEVAALSVLLAGVAVRLALPLFTPVAGSFLPRAEEMRFAPPPVRTGEAIRIGGGVMRLLPRRAALVALRASRDASRRFPWAARVTWPIVLSSAVALARWGDLAIVRAWVLAAAALGLLVQGAAVVGLGMLENRGPGWIDRSVGITPGERWWGRWAWSWGLSLWLVIPVGAAWSWWSGAAGAWLWPLAGALSAATATTASLLNAERR